MLTLGVLCLSPELIEMDDGRLMALVCDDWCEIDDEHLQSLIARGWLADVSEGVVAVTESGRYHADKWGRSRAGREALGQHGRVRDGRAVGRR